MPGRVVVTGVVLIITVAILVFITEFFLPLSIKTDMDMICRDTLLKMEAAGGLTSEEQTEIESELSGIGLENVTVNGTANARMGGSLRLQVDADFTYSKMSALLIRSNVTQHMRYDKTTMARRVIN